MRASERSVLLTTRMTGICLASALRSTKRVWGSGPSEESTSSTTPSTIDRPRSTSPPKSAWPGRSEEHTSELQANISYAVFCLKKKKNENPTIDNDKSYRITYTRHRLLLPINHLIVNKRKRRNYIIQLH